MVLGILAYTVQTAFCSTNHRVYSLQHGHQTTLLRLLYCNIISLHFRKSEAHLPNWPVKSNLPSSDISHTVPLYHFTTILSAKIVGPALVQDCPAYRRLSVCILKGATISSGVTTWVGLAIHESVQGQLNNVSDMWNEPFYTVRLSPPSLILYRGLSMSSQRGGSERKSGADADEVVALGRRRKFPSLRYYNIKSNGSVNCSTPYFVKQCPYAGFRHRVCS